MTTPLTVRPTSTTLSTTARPSFASSAMADTDRTTRSAVSPSLMRSRSEPAVPKLRFSLVPVSRSNSAPSADTTDFTAPALMTLISANVTSIVLGPDRGRAKAVRLGADAFNDRAAAHEFFLEPLKAAIEMIDAVDHGLALGCKGGNHKRHRGTEVSRHHRRALEAIDALNRCGLTVKLNARAKARKLLHMHEAVFEDRLRDTGRPFGSRHQCHQLRLQIGGKSRKWRSGHLDWRKPPSIPHNPNSFVGRRDRRACQAHHIQCGLKQFGARVLQKHIAARHRDGHGVSAGLDPIRQNRMSCAVQLRYAFNHNTRGAGPRNLCTHLVEAVSDIRDFRLARRVLND